MEAGGAKPHIVRAFDTDLAALDDTLVKMGDHVGTQIRDALAALVARDPAGAAAVDRADAAVDALEQLLNEQAVRLLALRQPKADDLRAVVTALRAATMLERAGDYAAGAARRGVADLAQPPGQSMAAVRRIGERVSDLLAQAVRAYLDQDVEAALAVWHGDVEIDSLHSSLFRELLTYMLEDPRDIGVCSHLLFVAKNLERIGDQATNIAELAHYRVTGTTPDGGRPKDDLATFATAEGRDGADAPDRGSPS
ncbi:phosphate signaling complex protein PhoU [Roseospira visakhapatnamensis]|uniref:Phosphate-specific transport system accessory protein PhoU n=1 Tax=Roseospira visakhapatnamensis TaxID=390880 RepID=A0A7W6WA32_9PROT|nr:phosphate signaling complex protein PhoU [Roseospira visakhapatnamensis]MBB4266780.1 phosphate transport system protein [Roseospira visakhapatnamensis]